MIFFSPPQQKILYETLKGISKGFRIGCDRSHPLRSARGNMRSAKEHMTTVADYLKEESDTARVCGPFPAKKAPCQLHLSPIGIIPKPHKPNKWRLIVDMSSPEGASINDSIAKDLATLSYIGIKMWLG